MEIDSELLQFFCDEAQDLLMKWESVCLSLSKEVTSELYQELFRIAHNLKGGSRSVGLLDYGDIVHKIEDGITLLRDHKIETTPERLSALLSAQQLLIDWITILKLDSTYKPETHKFLAEFEEKMNGAGANTTSVKKESTLKFTIPEKKEVIVAPVVDLVEEEIASVEKTKVTKKKGNARGNSSNNETIRISAQKLDHLIQTISELSIHQTIIWHTKNEKSEDSKIRLNSLHLSQKLTKELYDQALSLRMQPIQSVFQRLERNILDLSKSLNKEVSVSLSGSEVELDKSVIEKIIDPLTHIARNAIDHGVENSEERLQKNKPEKGHIAIEAHQDTFGVVLTIKDDGRGLVAEKIIKKAVEKGLIKENSAPPKEDVFNLIMLPGFSTAEKITDVSGRGVGMDVVAKTLEDLQGSIRIESEPDKGTSFHITLPTSMNIIDSILIKVCGQNYVVPVGVVEEVIDPNEVPLKENQEMFEWHNHIVPVQDLEDVLTHKNEHKSTEQKRALLICRYGNNRIAFLAERVLNQQQVVIRPLNENIDGAFGLMGGTILGNGEPGLIIDVPALMDHYLKNIKKYKEMAA